MGEIKKTNQAKFKEQVISKMQKKQGKIARQYGEYRENIENQKKESS
jgi:hypothetical protein